MLKLDYSGAMADIIGEKNGIKEAELNFFLNQLREDFNSFLKKKKDYGFVKIIKDDRFVEDSKIFYEENKNFKNIVVLGIGGSALGLKAILNLYCFRDLEKNFYVLDNIDPFFLSHIFGKIDLKETLFFVISKSGETVETLSQFMYAYNLVKQAGHDVREHFVFITDPQKGFLRDLARKEQIRAFEVPPELGGRFSVLSYVGLLPAGFLAEDLAQLIEGARIVEKNTEELFLFTTLLYLLNIRREKSNLVFFPYCDRLNMFCHWFSQLWAESLGKKYGTNNEILRTGQTPIVARGVTDQHSQLQLYLEGPQDKAVLMFKTNERVGLKIPEIFNDSESANYLNGKSFDELFDAEYKGTLGAFIKESVPVISFEIEELNLKTLGALFYFFELSCALSGIFYNINPFDQPAVEIGKRITFFILGKRGSENYLENIKSEKKYELSFHQNG